MAYTLAVVVFDEAGIFTRGTPPFAGTLSLSTNTPALSATSGGTPVKISFNAASPPFLSGTVLLTDPATPGDVFRSGPIINWPNDSVSINIVTVPVTPVANLPGFPGVGHFSYSQLGSMVAGSLPIYIDVPGWATALSLTATVFKFGPGRVWISSMSFMQSATGPGIVRALFGGFIDDSAGENGVNFTGSFDLKPTPSGDANDPANVIKIAAFNLSLNIDLASQFVVGILAGIFANFFAGDLSSPIADNLNDAIASAAAAVNVAGIVPGLTPTWTISAHSIAVLPGGITVQMIAADLPRPGLLTAAVAPQPKATTTGVDYTVVVHDAVTGLGIADARVTLNNFTQAGATTATSATTDPNGQAKFQNVALHTKRTVIHVSGGTNRAGKPEHDFDYGSESPSMEVSANGYVRLNRPLF